MILSMLILRACYHMFHISTEAETHVDNSTPVLELLIAMLSINPGEVLVMPFSALSLLQEYLK